MKVLLIAIFLITSSLSVSEHVSAKSEKSIKSSKSTKSSKSHKSNKSSKSKKSTKSTKSSKSPENDSSSATTISVDDQNQWDALVEKYLISGRSNPNYIHDQTETLDLVNDIANNEQIFFTRETHASHPSFARIYHDTSGQKTVVRTSAFTLGDKNQYHLFMRGDVKPMRYELRRKLHH
jgi:hypothetical protein